MVPYWHRTLHVCIHAAALHTWSADSMPDSDRSRFKFKRIQLCFFTLMNDLCCPASCKKMHQKAG